MEPIVMKHWGSIEDSGGSSPSDNSAFPDVSVDITKAMNKFCLAEFDYDHDDAEYQTDEVILSSMDPLVLYSVSLHKYINDLNEMIRVAELAIESNLIPPADAVPPMPAMPRIERKHVVNCFNFIPKEFTPFSLGEVTFCPELSSAVVKSILTKSVATMFAHIGFETTHTSVLNVLVDVLESFIKKVCLHLKIAFEDQEMNRLNGFSDIVEVVLNQLGLGGVKGLHDYYQTRVIGYIKVLQIRCNELHKHYENLLIQKNLLPDSKDNNVIHVELDTENVVDNPLLHLALDGEVEFSSLDAGYQLLNSLEANTGFVFDFYQFSPDFFLYVCVHVCTDEVFCNC
ncbi:hypothetical protein FQA39_LY17980 [Lamprigera yunnana]|nr:hypothetical protein FQA39_LY17980 [Lamprigera yunnana]